MPDPRTPAPPPSGTPRPHPRPARTLITVGAIAALACAVLHLGSARYSMALRPFRTCTVQVGWGQAAFVLVRGGPAIATTPAWVFESHREPLRWGFELETRGVVRWLAVPLWAPAAGSSLLAIGAAARARALRRGGACPNCGYALVGLGPGARRCPECGKPAPPGTIPS